MIFFGLGVWQTYVVVLYRRFSNGDLKSDKAKTLPWSCSTVIFAVISPITTNLVSPSCRRVFS
ncbi:unnamed protein product [Brassica napus]|uniref:(rape) hypothetical protein n=1 Tax=Brassica napus TaxID=3708 RepID=A0A816IRU6_BRANA|nr:unnamed protein product [Brassica napus]